MTRLAIADAAYVMGSKAIELFQSARQEAFCIDCSMLVGYATMGGNGERYWAF